MTEEGGWAHLQCDKHMAAAVLGCRIVSCSQINLARNGKSGYVRLALVVSSLAP